MFCETHRKFKSHGTGCFGWRATRIDVERFNPFDAELDCIRQAVKYLTEQKGAHNEQ
jgi:hypothetical protein